MNFEGDLNTIEIYELESLYNNFDGFKEQFNRNYVFPHQREIIFNHFNPKSYYNFFKTATNAHKNASNKFLEDYYNELIEREQTFDLNFLIKIKDIMKNDKENWPKIGISSVLYKDLHQFLEETIETTENQIRNNIML